jgi:hypothetical protein
MNDQENPMPAPAAARRALEDMGELTGKEAIGVVSVEPAGDGWRVGIEAIEERRIPSSADMLGLYLVDVGPDGEMTSVRRDRRYLRGSTETKAG